MRLQIVGPTLEIRAVAVCLVALASFIVALLIYTSVQKVMQQRLVKAYQKATFEDAFCDDHAAFHRPLCRESVGMSWQQIYTLLVEARVIDQAEIEDCAKLEGQYHQDDTPLHKLLETLRRRKKEEDKITPECSTRTKVKTKKSKQGQDQANHGNEGSIKAQTALYLIMELAQKQGLPESTTSGSFQEDILGYLPYALADTLGGGDLMGSERCVKALENLEDVDKEDFPVKPSGWRFSTEKCLSDAQILGHLLYKYRAIGGDEGAIPGYNVTKTNVMDELEGFEAFNRVQGYILGRLHQDNQVRKSQKLVNLVRGPEHVAILTLAILLSVLVALRWIEVEHRYAQARRTQGHEFAHLAMRIAIGGDAAERDHEALSRGRALVQWGLATIPAMGFIGTVRGILNALTKAGEIVWAADRLERADAIGTLAGELGLAFSTTFFALLAGVAVGLLVTVARVREGRCLDRLAGFGEERSSAK